MLCAHQPIVFCAEQMRGDADVKTHNPVDVIPRELALKLCGEIRQENRHVWYTFAAGQCWGCMTFTKGDPAKMCGGVVGCNLVMARYARHHGTAVHDS